ncbi:hypothetical protein [Brevundimonas sp.]|uniref:hypothetical protein n=1 Tax=Brevundimonas sp. TaxID=1871086 RepID=UPI003F6F4D81
MHRKAFARAVNRLSPTDAIAALGPADEAFDVEEMAGLLQRAGALVFRMANTDREARRDALIDALATAVAARLGTAAGDRIAGVGDLMQELEAGYRDVAHGLATAAVSSLPLDRQILAVLHRTALEADDIRRDVDAALAKAESIVPGQPLLVMTEDGAVYEANAGLQFHVSNLGSCLKLLVGRLDEERSRGPVVLPPLAETTEAERFKAGTSGLLATALRRWRRLEERRRFWGGDLIVHRPPDLPAGVAPTFEVIREHRRPVDDLWDIIANERQKDVFQRQADDVALKLADFDYGGLDRPTGLAPDALFSLGEAAALQALWGLLFAPAFEADQRFQGLTLREWVRGYAVLQALGERAVETETTACGRSLAPFRPGQLDAMLVAAGLTASTAARFIAFATLSDHSDDIFDCPLLRMSDGGSLLFTPAVTKTVIARVVLSNLAALGERFENKGDWFEAEVLAFFRSHGFSAFTIKTTLIAGEPYQLDVLVPWDDHLFVFECKNEALSGGDPVAAYNFERGRQGHVAQIQRQVGGLRTHPELALKAGGPDPRTSTIIPVVLYAFPYARPSDEEEVAIADWSGVTRFFRNPTLGFTTRHALGDGDVLARHHETTRLWQGDAPTVADFIAHLRAPSQVTLKAEALDVVPGDFLLCDHRGARTTEVVAGNPRSAATPRAERALRASIARAEREARAITRRKLEHELRQSARRARRSR